MNPLVERRTRQLDPIDVVSPEVFALLKLCGGARRADRAPTLDEVSHQIPPERRRHARRGTDTAYSPT